MPLMRFAQKQGFNPEDIKVLVAAWEAALAELRLSQHRTRGRKTWLGPSSGSRRRGNATPFGCVDWP